MYSYYKYKYNKYSQKMSQIGGVVYKEHLSQPFFDDIRNGEKKYEGRVRRKIWADIAVGDIVTWWNDDGGNYQEYSARVSHLSYFDTFKEAIESVGLQNILPSEHKIGSDIETAIQNVYRRWYDETKENTYHVVLLKFELI
jgi:ASC-1-like (ASCH) protein